MKTKATVEMEVCDTSRRGLVAREDWKTPARGTALRASITSAERLAGFLRGREHGRKESLSKSSECSEYL
jgi:hypothetical protein